MYLFQNSEFRLDFSWKVKNQDKECGMRNYSSIHPAFHPLSFHMLVTARLTDGRDGCLAQLVSNDLRTWKLIEPFIIPGRVTDCSHHFEWNGWYYLFAEYVYWMSRNPLGPWIKPEPDRLDVLYVPKTAAFKGNRRIYVSWLPDGGWGGNAIFREMIQHEDGTREPSFSRDDSSKRRPSGFAVQ